MVTSDTLVDVLRLGFVAVAFLFAWFAYLLLRREQQLANPRAPVIKAIYVFMAFSLVLAGAQLFLERTSKSDEAAARRDETAASVKSAIEPYRLSLAKIASLVDAKVEFELREPSECGAIRTMAGQLADQTKLAKQQGLID
jgi:hypothetical protein